MDELAQKRDIQTDLMIENSTLPTITKTRMVAQNQQLLRIDEETVQYLQEEEEKMILEKAAKMLSELDAIILPDYGKGFLSPAYFLGKSLSWQENINALWWLIQKG